MVYVYDGSFEGLLTAVHEAYYRHEVPSRIIAGAQKIGFVQESLLNENVYILTDQEKSDRVYQSILDKISEESLQNIYHVFLSELEDAGTWIYEYLRLGFKMGGMVNQHLSDERVLRIIKTAKRVTGEVHLMLGLLRFKLLESRIFYAVMEPDFNILEMISPHFADRLASQNWIIHDVKRNQAALFDQQGWFITELSLANHPELSSKEADYQDFWQRYFKTIAIQSRVNPKLQRQHMPRRYWKHLVEME
jgi:probable DNA metabolism protein